MEKLTMRQKRFVEEYLVDLNATKAAIRAGYNAKSAGKSASGNLKKPGIRAHIEEAMTELSQRTGVNQERVIEELSRVAFADFDREDREAGPVQAHPGKEKAGTGISQDTGDAANRTKAGDPASGQIPGGSGQEKDSKATGRNSSAAGGGRPAKSATREVRLGDKLKALELLGKHLGMFGDKAQGSIDKIPQIIDDIGGGDEA